MWLRLYDYPNLPLIDILFSRKGGVKKRHKRVILLERDLGAEKGGYEGFGVKTPVQDPVRSLLLNWPRSN
jgi:hypothetical protein